LNLPTKLINLLTDLL